MNQRGKRLAILAVGVVAIVVAFVIASSGGGNDDSKTTATGSMPTTAQQPQSTDTPTPAKPEVPTVVVKGAKPVGGVQKITVKKGEQIRFKVKSDVSDEIHVHGYDFHKDVKAGGSVTFSFPAKIDGIFVVELESRGEQIASLEVEP